MTYYRLIISFFILSLGQGVFAAAECILCAGDDNACVLCNQSSSPPATTTVVSAKRKATAAAIVSAKRNASDDDENAPAVDLPKLPLVAALIQYKKGKMWPGGKKMRLNCWLTDLNLSTKLENALEALENGASSCYKISKKFDIPKRTLDRYYNILKNIVSVPALSSATWEAKYVLLQAYVLKHEHANVPKKYPGLGPWVARQRLAYKGDRLSDDQIAKLNALGFDWNPGAAVWEANLKLLQAYVLEHGHARVPSKLDTDKYPKLGSWISHQREAYRNEKRLQYKEAPRRHMRRISPAQIAKLESLGFKWKVPLGRKKQPPQI